MRPSGGVRAAPPYIPRPAIIFLEKRCQLIHHCAAKLFGVDNRHRPAIVAGDIMADADGDQLDRRAGFDIANDLAEMAFEVITGEI